MNNVNIYEPRTMVESLMQVQPVHRFLRNTFFGDVKLHYTRKIDLDVFKGKRRIATFVNPIHDGRVVEREGFSTYTVEPGYTKEKMPITIADTMTRAMGENLYQASTPAQRMQQLLGQDLQNLMSRLDRLEEKMCAEAMVTGKVVMKGVGMDLLVDFGYEPGTHLITLSGSDVWGTGTAPSVVPNPNANPITQLDYWRREINKRCGIAPTHCICGYDAAWALYNNPEVRDLMKTYQANIVTAMVPENFGDGVSYYGKLRLPSGVVDIISYEEYYTDPSTGESMPIIPPNVVVLGNPGARSTFNYGLIQNMFADLAPMPRFPRSWIEEDGSARWLQLESAPLPNLTQIDAFMSITVM